MPLVRWCILPIPDPRWGSWATLGSQWFCRIM